MEAKIRAFLITAVACLMLTGCQISSLQQYSDDIELRCYGNVELPKEEIAKIDELALRYSNCLFNIGKQEIDAGVLKELAPNEQLEEWEAVYRENKTVSELLSYQLADLYVKTQTNVECLCICEAKYSDWKTPEGNYVFVVRLLLNKNGTWTVESSELLGTANKTNAIVMRNAITGHLTFEAKGGDDS